MAALDMARLANGLDVPVHKPRMKKAAWRRNKYRSNPEFREREKEYSRQYQRMKRQEGKEDVRNDNVSQL